MNFRAFLAVFLWTLPMLAAEEAIPFGRATFVPDGGDARWWRAVEEAPGLLWQAYPRIGVDERNQFGFYRDLLGGLKEVRRLIRQAHARGVMREN